MPDTDQKPAELSKTYSPEQHEPGVWQRWLEADAFHADPAEVLSGDKPPYCVLIPPPNVTAALHLGHALNNTIQDVLVRAHRMKGFETLWLPGTDHAGIATQTVVDTRLKEAGKPALAEHKAMERAGEPGREKFIALVQSWKDEYEARITDQLKAMGCSCDWDRQRFTMDELCARAVREAFFRLFKDGLIERGKRLVNWDPATQTALSDDEVENKEIEGHFYYLRYPLCHRTEPGNHNPVTWGELEAKGYPGADTHPEDDEAWITVATTRPETYLGDVAVAMNPKDPRAEALKGLLAEIPLTGRTVPILQDDYVVLPIALGGDENDAKAKMATGFLKVTPAHDPNDWMLGQRHQAAIEQHCSAGTHLINVMAPDGSISADHGWPDFEPHGAARVFIGLSREDARQKVVKEFQAHTINTQPLLEDIKPHTHTVGHSYRSHVPVEPYLSDQWYCRVTDDRLRGHAQRALKPEQRTPASLDAWAKSRPEPGPGADGTGDGSMTFYPSRYAKTYETWHDNLRDWCISRQLWWGHRIPVWSKEYESFEAMESEVDGPIYKALKKYKHAVLGADEVEGSQNDGSVFICLGEHAPEAEHVLIDHGFTQDPDVLDTWFSSALWPLSTLGWPNHDLPLLTPEKIDPLAHPNIKSVWVKRVGTFRDFIGTEGEPSGDLIEKLLHLRDTASTADGTQPLAYQLFSEADLARDGHDAQPLTKTKDIGEATDLVCAVGVKSHAPLEATKFGVIDIPALLRAHGFQDTPGLLAAFNPTSVLTTAREIITLWVSRMAMFNRYFLGNHTSERAATVRERSGSPEPSEETASSRSRLVDAVTPGPIPFHDVFIHAMIQDGEGRKMSKSLGNGVDPLDIIHSHGADAMRFTLVEMTTQTQDVRMPVEHDESTGKNTSPKFDLGRNFCNKLWNAARFALSKIPSDLPETIDPADLTLADRWMLTRLREGLAEIDNALATYQFSAYAKALYDLVRRDFCDWYLEAIKGTVAGNPAQQGTLRLILDSLLRLLHPVIPFITETIHERLSTFPAPSLAGLTLTPPEKGDVLATAGWPAVDESLADADAKATFERVRTIVDEIRAVRSANQVEPRRKVSLHASAELAREITAASGLVESLAGLHTMTTDAPEGPSAAFTLDGVEHRLADLADALDAGAERERLEKEKADLEKSIKALEGRLGNPGYTEKAPPHLVQQTRDEHAKAQADLDAIKASLESLA